MITGVEVGGGVIVVVFIMVVVVILESSSSCYSFHCIKSTVCTDRSEMQRSTEVHLHSQEAFVVAIWASSKWAMLTSSSCIEDCIDDTAAPAEGC